MAGVVASDMAAVEAATAPMVLRSQVRAWATAGMAATRPAPAAGGPGDEALTRTPRVRPETVARAGTLPAGRAGTGGLVAMATEAPTESAAETVETEEVPEEHTTAETVGLRAATEEAGGVAETRLALAMAGSGETGPTQTPMALRAGMVEMVETLPPPLGGPLGTGATAWQVGVATAVTAATAQVHMRGETVAVVVRGTGDKVASEEMGATNSQMVTVALAAGAEMARPMEGWEVTAVPL